MATAVQVCRSCEFGNPADMSFCGRCGTPLAAERLRGLGSQERRRLTVLFCDLVGSTALSERMDVEEFEDLLRRYQEACTAIVRAHDGFVARYVGDALLVLFGYPQALEDAPAQAARAAFSMIAAMATLSGSDAAGQIFSPSVRIGIATGDVVVGDLVGATVIERAAVRGLAPNLASRLQSVAEPNSIVVSEETRRRLPASFEVLDLGDVEIRGLQRSERVFRVTSERAAPLSGMASRFRGGAAVGRDVEHARLQRYWEQATGGRSRVVVVGGDPGIGKSRLLRDFCNRLKEDRKRSAVLSCSSTHRDSAFYPLAAELRRLLRLSWTASPQLVLHRLEAMTDASGLARSEAVPLLADLLSVDAGSGYVRLMLTPPRRRERLLDVLAALLRHWLGERPLLVVVEDMQWADPSMAETVLGLLKRMIGTPYLCIATRRNPADARWMDEMAPEILHLARLDQACSAGLALAVTGASSLPPAVLLGIVERAEGVPLFIEELVKNAVEAQASGGVAACSTLIPGSLQESLIARLDRMVEGKAVAQIAAVLGRRFSVSLLARVAPLTPMQLETGLSELAVAGLLAPEQGEQDDRYMFHHALIRDAAYSTLLMRVRRRLHREVAAVLAQRAEPSESPAVDGPEILAQHLTLGENWEPAVEAWLAAGQRAYERLELSEAMAHFRHGLDLLHHLDLETSRARELALRAGYGAACMLLRGYAAPEVNTSFTRAYELSGDIVEPSVFRIVWGVWAFQVSARRNRFGEAAADRLSLIAAASQDRSLQVLAHTAQAATRGALGQLARSEQEARAAILLYDPVLDRNLAPIYTMDPKALSLLFLRHVLWIQGRAAEADAVATACLEFAQHLGHAFVVPYVLIWGGAPLVYAGRMDEAIASMTEGVALARASRLDLWSLTGELWRGAALIGRGDMVEGVALLEEQLSNYQVTGVRLAVPYLQAILASALSRMGRGEDALGLITAAIEECDGDSLHAAEIRRLRGDVLLAIDPAASEAAADCYRLAIQIAQCQGAGAWETRAQESLCQLGGRGSRASEWRHG